MKRKTLLDLYRETEGWILGGASILAAFLFLRLVYSGADRFFVLGLSALVAVLFFMFINFKYGRLPFAEHAGINRRGRITSRDKKLLFFFYVLMVTWVGIKADVEDLLELGVGNDSVGHIAAADYIGFYVVGVVNFICVGIFVRGYASSRLLFECEIHWIRCIYAALCLLALLGLSFIVAQHLRAESITGILGDMAFSLVAWLLALYCLVRFLLNMPRK